MVKFIEYWMFANHLWTDAPSTPIVINLREISHIDEVCNPDIGDHIVVFLKNETKLPIEGNIIDVLASFQKHLTTMY